MTLIFDCFKGFVHSNMEFTCIVYYAQEFEDLQKQCGIQQIMIESLCRCQPWQTSGGKSKSRFYKTKGTVLISTSPYLLCLLSYCTLISLLYVDDRFVIKEMISSWNLAEKQQFLRFAPAYFDYMKRTTSEVAT